MMIMNNQNRNTSNQGESRRNVLTGILLGLLIGLAFGWIQNNFLIGIGMGLPLGIALGIAIDRRIPTMRMAAFRLRRILIALALFVILLNFALFLPEGMNERWNIFILPLPVLSGAWMVIAIGQAIASLDEMQRRIQTEAIAIGFALLSLIALGYGMAGILLSVPQINWLFFLAAMPLCWLVGKVWTLRRYGQ
jgi:hypothetical protein